MSAALIAENFEFLTHNLKNIERVLVLLKFEGILTEEIIQRILNKPSFGQNVEFFSTLKILNVENAILSHILKSTDNNDLLEIFSTTSSDTPIGQESPEDVPTPEGIPDAINPPVNQPLDDGENKPLDSTLGEETHEMCTIDSKKVKNENVEENLDTPIGLESTEDVPTPEGIPDAIDPPVNQPLDDGENKPLDSTLGEETHEMCTIGSKEVKNENVEENLETKTAPSQNFEIVNTEICAMVKALGLLETVVESADVKQSAKSLLDFENIYLMWTGPFSKVFQVTEKDSGKIYAIKILKETNAEKTRREVPILQQVNNPYVIKLVDSWIEEINDDMKSHQTLKLWLKGFENLHCIQTEWCEGDHLQSWIYSKNEKSERDAKLICYQIACGVQHLHEKDLLHRDLKPENIFLVQPYKKDDENLQIKIGDLGLSRMSFQVSKGSKYDKMTKGLGNEYYRAPEAGEDGTNYTKAVDVFAMGRIMYEVIMAMATKNPEYNNEENVITSPWFINNYKSENELLTKMLSEDSANRPLATEVRKQLNELWKIDNN